MADLGMQLYSQFKGLSFEDQKNAWGNLNADEQKALLVARERANTYRAEDAFNTGNLQGLTYGESEELGGFLRKIPDGQTQDEYLAEQRLRQEDLQALYPKTYLAGDVAGSLESMVIPGVGWVAGPARAARAVTTAGKALGVMGRGALWGGVNASAQAFGRAEGGFGPRITNAIQAAPIGATTGLFVAPVVGAALSSIGRSMGETVRLSVEKNLRKIAESEGVDMSVILQRVMEGETVAGMNATTRAAVRAIKNLNPRAGQELLNEALRRRTGAQETALETTERELVGPRIGPPPGNLYAKGTTELGAARERAGEALSGAREAAGIASPKLQNELTTALARNPDVSRKMDNTLRTMGREPLLDADGNLRPLTIAEAETIYGELHDTATSLFKGDAMSTQRASAIVETYRPLRDLINAERGSRAAGLPAARAASAEAIQAEKQGFPLGREFLTKQPEPFAQNPRQAVEDPGFADLAPPGQEAARLGAATALRGRAAAPGTGNKLMEAMLDENLGGMNLGTMVGKAGMERVGPTVDKAINEHRLVEALVGGSNTAPQLAAEAALKRGASSLPGQLGEVLQQGPLNTAIRSLRHIVGGADDLDDAELMELGRMLIASGPEGERMIRAAVAGDSKAASFVRRGIRSFQRNAVESVMGRRGATAATANLTGGLTDEQRGGGFSNILDLMGVPH